MAKKLPVSVDPTLPKVTAEVNGVKYSLCFDFGAICIAEEATGLNLLRALDFQNLSAGTFRALLYAALLKAQPETTLESAGALINLKTAPLLMSALGKAYTDSQAEPDEDEPKNVQEPEAK